MLVLPSRDFERGAMKMVVPVGCSGLVDVGSVVVGIGGASRC